VVSKLLASVEYESKYPHNLNMVKLFFLGEIVKCNFSTNFYLEIEILTHIINNNLSFFLFTLKII